MLGYEITYFKDTIVLMVLKALLLSIVNYEYIMLII